MPRTPLLTSQLGGVDVVAGIAEINRRQLGNSSGGSGGGGGVRDAPTRKSGDNATDSDNDTDNDDEEPSSRVTGAAQMAPPLPPVRSIAEHANAEALVARLTSASSIGKKRQVPTSAKPGPLTDKRHSIHGLSFGLGGGSGGLRAINAGADGDLDRQAPSTAPTTTTPTMMAPENRSHGGICGAGAPQAQVHTAGRLSLTTITGSGGFRGLRDVKSEAEIVESWLDDNPEFARDYFMRKAGMRMVEDWLAAHARLRAIDPQPPSAVSAPPWSSSAPSVAAAAAAATGEGAAAAASVASTTTTTASGLAGTVNSGELEVVPEARCMVMSSEQRRAGSCCEVRSQTPVMVPPARKISATDFEAQSGTGYLRPMVSTAPDGRPTFLGPHPSAVFDDGVGVATDFGGSGGGSSFGGCRSPQRASTASESYSTGPARSPRGRRTSDSPSITWRNASMRNERIDANEDSILKQQQQLQHELQQQQQLQQQLQSIEPQRSEGKFGELQEAWMAGGNGTRDEEAPPTAEEPPPENDEMKFVFDLVKNICQDLDMGTLLHKILKNIAILINADKSSLFLVCGEPGDPNRHLVSHLFDVDQNSSPPTSKDSQCQAGATRSQTDGVQLPTFGKNDGCIRIPWNTGLVGWVAESGEALNIADCYEDPRFTKAIDQQTGYVTRHMLCAPIYDKRNEIVGVAQVINKCDGRPFTRQDEIKFERYLQFCGIGLRNAQSYEQCQLENRRNQLLLDLARMVFEEQSTIEQVVHRIMLHTQSLLDCQRCQVLLLDDGSDDLDRLLALSPVVPTIAINRLSHHPSATSTLDSERQQEQPPALSDTYQTGHRQEASEQPPPRWRPQCQSKVVRSSEIVAAVSERERTQKKSFDDDNTTDTGSQLTSDSNGEEESEPIADDATTSTATDAGCRQASVASTTTTQGDAGSARPKLFALVFDLECDGDSDPVITHRIAPDEQQHHQQFDDANVTSSRCLSPKNTPQRRFPINIGITGYVARTGETLNIADAHECSRFDKRIDEGSNFRHKSILCMPIRNGRREVIGVSQLINKKNGRPFNKNDEDLFEAFSIFCGLGIHNTLMYERVLKIMAKQRVTFEVLSYHATAPLEEAKKLHQEPVPSSLTLNLTSLKFNDFCLDEPYMLRACHRFFLDLDLIRRFQIDQLVFCNWILSVQKNYRNVTYHPIVGGTGLKAAPVRYHNWRHAFNVSQMMFAILVNTQVCPALGELETLALMIACLCHDLDHRGTNNSFQVKCASPLAELYSTSTMEHHHFDQCVMILNSQGNQILANLSPEEYSRVIALLKEAILATDLANYFKRRELFFKLVNSNRFDWTRNSSHRSLLRCMLMTACDVAASTKPWSVQKVVAELVMSEFYQQGDFEKQELHLEPIDMMNREKRNELPTMQIDFINSICCPLYEAFAKLFPDELTTLHQGCLANRRIWAELAAKKDDQHYIDGKDKFCDVPEEREE